MDLGDQFQIEIDSRNTKTNQSDIPTTVIAAVRVRNFFHRNYRNFGGAILLNFSENFGPAIWEQWQRIKFMFVGKQIKSEFNRWLE